MSLALVHLKVFAWRAAEPRGRAAHKATRLIFRFNVMVGSRLKDKINILQQMFEFSLGNSPKRVLSSLFSMIHAACLAGRGATIHYQSSYLFA